MTIRKQLFDDVYHALVNAHEIGASWDTYSSSVVDMLIENNYVKVEPVLIDTNSERNNE